MKKKSPKKSSYPVVVNPPITTPPKKDLSFVESREARFIDLISRALSHRVSLAEGIKRVLEEDESSDINSPNTGGMGRPMAITTEENN